MVIFFFKIPQGDPHAWWVLFCLRGLIGGLLSLLLRLSHYPDEINLSYYIDIRLAIRLLRHSDTAVFIYQFSNFRFANIDTRHLKSLNKATDSFCTPISSACVLLYLLDDQLLGPINFANGVVTVHFFFTNKVELFSFFFLTIARHNYLRYWWEPYIREYLKWSF